MCRAASGQVVLGCVRRQTEQGAGSKPGSSILLSLMKDCGVELEADVTLSTPSLLLAVMFYLSNRDHNSDRAYSLTYLTHCCETTLMLSLKLGQRKKDISVFEKWETGRFYSFRKFV